MSQYVVTAIVALLIVVFIIYQQMRTRTIEPRRLIVVPVILALLGLFNLQKHSPATTAADIALGASVSTAIVFGIARGMSVRIVRAGGGPVRTGTAITLLLWVAGIAVRVVIGILAGKSGVSTSVSTGELPLFLGITLAAQNALIWVRSQGAEIGTLGRNKQTG